MTAEWLIAVTVFCLVASWTPGPNNTFLMASGLTFGFRRTLPPALGVALGFAAMMLAVAFGISQLFEAWPALYTILRVVSVAYLIWLAWRIATAEPTVDDSQPGARPLTFLEAAAFQWINPKAWSIALFASAAYVVDSAPTTSVLAITAIVLATGLSSSTGWALGGTALRALIENRQMVRAINIALALLLLLSLLPIISELIG